MKRSELSGYTFAVVDLLTALLIVFMALSVLALTAAQKQKSTVSPGSLVVTLYWTRTANCDVDLWGSAPGESQPVGYSHRDGLHLNLLRDDLGRARDPMSRNMEMMVSRGLPAGEWIFNAVLYASYDHKFPVGVLLVVQDRNGNTLLQARGNLTYVGQEITLARFRLDPQGHILPGSINRLFRPLYKAGKSG